MSGIVKLQTWRSTSATLSLLEQLVADFYLFAELGSYLTTEALAGLYLALCPKKRDMWFHPRLLAEWGKRLPLNGRRCKLIVNPHSPLLNMSTFMTMRHLYEHGQWDTYRASRFIGLDVDEEIVRDECGGGFRDVFITDFFHRHSIECENRVYMLVRACLFLPVIGPPDPFAGNLVVMGVGGALIFYAPSLTGFFITCSVQLQCSPHNLAMSPDGTSLLAAGTKNSVFVHLSDHRAECLFTGVPVHQSSFLGQCFSAENVFLTTDEAGNVWEHEVLRGGVRMRFISMPRKRWKCCLLDDGAGHDHCGYRMPEEAVVITRCLVGQREYGPTRWPFTYGEKTAGLALVYKQHTRATEACLILAGMAPRSGLGPVLRLIFSPHRKRKKGGRDVFVFFPRALVSSVAVHPSNESVFVVVLSRMKREEFFRHPPLVEVGRQPSNNAQRFDRRVTGVVGVYELTFAKRPRVRVVPRYFLDAAPASRYYPYWRDLPGVPEEEEGKELRAYRMYTDLLLEGQQGHKIQVQARCGLTHLVIRLDSHWFAHIPLISSPESTIVCQNLDAPCREWCFSEYHHFGILFGPGIGRRFFTPLVACIKYNRFHPDVAVINALRRPATSTLRQALLRGRPSRWHY